MSKREIIDMVLKNHRPPYVPWSFSFTKEAINGLSKDMRLILKEVTIPEEGDLVICFDAMAEDALAGFGEIISRQLIVSLEGKKPNEHTADEVLNYIGMDDFYPCSFYFRQAGLATVDIEIEVEGGGMVNLRSIRLVNESQALVSAFEHGIVLANPSDRPCTFDLASLFPEMHLKRLQASPGQDADVNSGKTVGDKVTLPALDRLILIRIK